MIRLPDGLGVYALSKAETELIFREVFVSQVYARHGIQVRPGDCVLDIGANIGMFALYLHQTCPDARVYSFEPIPRTFEILQKNLALHGCCQVTPLNLGLSRSLGAANFTFFPRLPGNSTMHPEDRSTAPRRWRTQIMAEFQQLPNPFLRGVVTRLPKACQTWIAELVRRYYNKQESVDCQLSTISHFIAEHAIERVGLIKVDVERAEVDILAGVDDADWPKIRQLVLEVHQGVDPHRDIAAMLRERDYEVVIDQAPGLEFNSMVYAKRNAA